MNEQLAKQFVQDIQEQKRIERERQKPSPNKRMAEDAKDYLDSYPFWCDECEKDFDAECHKTWHRLYGDWIAVYRGYCDCGEECVRHITHKDHDPYYQKSERINRDKNHFAVETLQAEEYGFRTHYGEPWKEYYAKLQRAEEKIITGEREKGFGGLSFQSQEELKRIRNL